MTRNTLRGFGLLASFALVMSITAGNAQARKPKHHKGGAAAEPAPAPADTGSSGGGMTFQPDVVTEQPSTSGKKKAPMSFTPEAVSKPAGPAGPPSKVLERALKLYDAEDYANASIELNKVIEGQSGDDEANK